jgi:predicted CXXCH cytochrome family protein
VAVVLVVLLVAVAASRAGDFHYIDSLVCSDCHVMHYSESHLMSGAAGPDPILAPGGPFRYLLKTSPSALCLACHDGRVDAPDVRGAHSNGYTRAAGQLNVQGDGPAVEGTGHTLNSVTAPPGGTWTNPGLTCQNCHDTHGNPYYRNLVANPGTATGKTVTYMIGNTYTPTRAIQEIVGFGAPLASHYDVSNVRYRQTATGSDFGLSEWCSGCHGTYHGAGGAANMGGAVTGDAGNAPWLRHPTRDVTMANAVTNKRVNGTHWFGALASRVPVVSPSGTIPGTGPASDNQVFCGSCHKAHGSPNPKGLIFDDETTAVAEDGLSLMPTCQQCHYQ